MNKIEFNFEDNEGVKLQWAKPDSRVGYIRIHKDPLDINSPVLYSLIVEIYHDKTYEFKMLKKENEGEVNLRRKLVKLSQYLHDLGYTGVWSRRNEKNPKDFTLSGINIGKKDN